MQLRVDNQSCSLSEGAICSSIPRVFLQSRILTLLSPCGSTTGPLFLFVQVGYDNTVRDGEGCVHQFLYGEDGVDTTQTK